MWSPARQWREPDLSRVCCRWFLFSQLPSLLGTTCECHTQASHLSKLFFSDFRRWRSTRVRDIWGNFIQNKFRNNKKVKWLKSFAINCVASELTWLFLQIPCARCMCEQWNGHKGSPAFPRIAWRPKIALCACLPECARVLWVCRWIFFVVFIWRLFCLLLGRFVCSHTWRQCQALILELSSFQTGITCVCVWTPSLGRKTKKGMLLIGPNKFSSSTLSVTCN